ISFISFSPPFLKPYLPPSFSFSSSMNSPHSPLITFLNHFIHFFTSFIFYLLTFVFNLILIRGVQLLMQARSFKNKSRSAINNLANEALAKAQKTSELNLKDIVSYLLKAMVLDLDLEVFRNFAVIF
ncbi:hypothetical protein KIW84_060494, partial [Lathyrus oleraceus]